MSEHSQIEWTDATWNPVRGCTKISPGCKHCYAQTFAERFRGVPNHPYELGFDLRTVPSMLSKPLAWSTPKRIFVNSMSDLLHDQVPDDFVFEVFEVMMRADWHIFQVLTKRAERLKSILARAKNVARAEHIWWGVSVENRVHGIPRIGYLRESSARNKFLSIEPLLEDLGRIEVSGIDWVIVGGESGFGARPMEKSWVLNIKEQCEKHRVQFFFKQWGGVRKKETGRLLNGKTYDAVPANFANPVPTLSERRELIQISQCRALAQA